MVLGSVKLGETLSSRARRGRRRRCELCERERPCTERYRIVACVDCGAALLPRGALR